MIAGIIKVRNESLILEDTLNHMLRHVEKVYLYDDASTDNSMEIASSFNKVEVIRGVVHNPNRELEETRLRSFLLDRVNVNKHPWVLSLDADERIEGIIPDPRLFPHDTVGIRFKLFDGYLTPKTNEEYVSGNLAELPRMWGPERRDIVMLFRAPNASFVGLDQREPVLANGRTRTANIYVKHFGKCLSVQHWEDTCAYYETWPKYADKWRARRGKAIHDLSDFGSPLYSWDEVKKNYG